jgi:hypothetical protein
MGMCSEIGRDDRWRKCFGAAAQRGDASAGGGDFEKRIMLKDCRDATWTGGSKEGMMMERK